MISKFHLKAARVIVLVFILLAALLVRQSTFWLPHWRGDQEHYLALAMKLSKFGLDGYNLRKVDVKVVNFEIAPGYEGTLAELVPAQEGEKGFLLASLEQAGIMHYDNPLHHIAPAFPYALMLSNKIFGRGRFTGVRIESSRIIKYIRPPEAFGPQFYAVIVPLVFSLLTVVVIYLLGSALFSFRIGAYAAFIYAFNAVDLMTSQRIWTDDMAVFFAALSVLLFVGAVPDKKKSVLFFLSGISCGLATVTRQNLGVMLFPPLVYLVACARRDMADFKLHRAVFNKSSGLFLGAFFLAAFFWFWKTFQTYGNPIYTPQSASAEPNWYGLIQSRPPSIILYTAGLVCISPVFIFAYGSIRNLFSAVRSFVKGKLSGFDADMILLFSWIFAFIFLFALVFQGKEERYLLPAYPAFSVLSAWGLSRARLWLLERLGKNQIILSELIICSLLAAYAVWSVNIGNTVVLEDKSLIMVPF